MTSLLLLLILQFFIAVARQCSQEQANYLLQLKEGFSSPPPNLFSWKNGSDCCQWNRVSCDSSGLVSGLDLSNSSIKGKINDALFNLTSLTSLNLSYNKFDNISLSLLPFERLTKLENLNLSNAGKFEGQIPIGIGRLTKLVSLDLSSYYFYQLNSSLWLQNPSFGTLIQNLTRLKELVLDGVNISASGEEWSGAVSRSIPGIQVLSLASCSLSGPIDASFTSLKSLSVLRLDQNSLSSSIPEFFGNFSSLCVLRLQNCALQEEFPAKIFQLPNLTYLDISGNLELSGQLPEFAEGSPLQALILSSTNISGTIPESIGKLRWLTTLQLYACKYYGQLPNSLGNLMELMLLDLSFNKFSGEIPRNPNWFRILQIVLSNNNLTGQIPHLKSEVFQNLMILDFTNNSISGPIPAHLFALPSLKFLLLSQNKLSGQLDEVLNVSLTLETLDLTDNELEGSIPLSFFQLSSLKVLKLASNNFSGALQLDNFFILKKLTYLDLSNNLFSVKEGFNQSLLPSFPMLSTLKLVSCNLTKIPGFLKSQRQIETLDLSNNKIDGVIPKWIWGIGNPTLTYLNLSCNMFKYVKAPIGNLSMQSPIILDLHSNHLQGAFPVLPFNTIILDYSINNFTGSINHNLTLYLDYTIFLSLSSNHLTGEIPPSICNATYLQVLDLSNNSLNGVIPPCLMESAPDLRVVNLGMNQLSGSLPQNFNNCGLHSLNLNNNQLTGVLPQSIENCGLLEVLDLGYNKIMGHFPSWLGNLPWLRVLVLRNNGLYGSFLEPPLSSQVNNNFTMLQIFDVSNNNFTGGLPAECFKNLKAMKLKSDGYKEPLGFPYLQLSSQSYYQNTVTVTIKGLYMTLEKILTIFTSVDFSNNNFTGNIPEVIGELNSLLLLNLSHNSLTGEIPRRLGNLSQLESLDLSSNHLSGDIPQELAQLHFLSTLNLSYNSLVGIIPQTQQFQTFSSSSYVGNEGLCGLPLTKKCNPASSNPYIYSSISLIEFNWRFIFIGLGFGVGLAVAVSLLMFWPVGKKWHNRLVDNMHQAVMTPLFSSICGDGKVGAKDLDDSMETEDDDRQFCIFCTKLEFREGRAVIHHFVCSCNRLQESSESICTEYPITQRNGR